MVSGGHASRDAVLGMTLSFTILAVIAASLRLLTRFFISRAAGADDAFVAISTVSLLIDNAPLRAFGSPMQVLTCAQTAAAWNQGWSSLRLLAGAYPSC